MRIVALYQNNLSNPNKEKMIKIFKRSLVFLRIAKQSGNYPDGTPCLNGLNTYNPLSFLFMVIASPIVGIIEGVKAIYIFWKEAW